MPKLENLKGTKVVVRLVAPLYESEDVQFLVALVDVEATGVWLEGHQLADREQARSGKVATKTPVFFVPFSNIVWILSSLDTPYLSETAFGLRSF